MYFWPCERAANIHPYANVNFPLNSSTIGSNNSIFLCLIEKYFNHSHFSTNTALRIKFNAHYVFTKILIFSYNNAQIHPKVTVQYLKSIPFVQKAWKTCGHTSASDKNQFSSQTKGFMHSSVQKILGTCERVANIFLHPGANYTYMYNLHTVCKSAHVNGA